MPKRPLRSRTRAQRVQRWIACVALLFVASAKPAVAATEERKSCSGAVCVHMIRDDYKVIFEGSTTSKLPVGIKIEFERLRNVLADQRLPFEGTIPPGRRVYLLKLVQQNPRQGFDFPFRWYASEGDPRAEHDDRYLYRMPFGGREDRMLSQGPNGSFSHTGAHRHSWDFAMPIGTPILAARSGRVVHVADGYTDAGSSEAFLPAANAVTLMHTDGTYATYAHLDPGSGVREGMWVRTGEMLGFSGNTGFSTGPHLHFAIWKGGYRESQTLPIRFRGPDGRPMVPVEMQRYRPGCRPGGRACSPGEIPREPVPARQAPPVERNDDGSCRCRNGAVITTNLPCRAVCP